MPRPATDDADAMRRVVRAYLRAIGPTPGLTVIAAMPGGEDAAVSEAGLGAWARGERAWPGTTNARNEPL